VGHITIVIGSYSSVSKLLHILQDFRDVCLNNFPQFTYTVMDYRIIMLVRCEVLLPSTFVMSLWCTTNRYFNDVMYFNITCKMYNQKDINMELLFIIILIGS